MLDRQSDHLDMFRAVSKHASDNQAITDTMVAFKNGITDLDGKITAIEDASGEHQQRITGVAKEKQDLRIVLCEVTYGVISPVKAYAFFSNNRKLEEEMAYSLRNLKRVKDDEIGALAQGLWKIVNPLVASLGDYGIAAAGMTAWQNAINNYKTSVASPRIAITHKATITKELKKLFAEAGDILKKIVDPLAIVFKNGGNGHYYNEYLKARIIVNSGGGKTRVTGTGTSKSTGNPIYNMKITVNEQGIQAFTDVNGKYVRTVKHGTMTCTAEAPGCVSETTAPFVVKLGETVVKDFELVPSEIKSPLDDLDI